jgi:hypothetical protein
LYAKEIYLYDESVATVIDLDAYLADGPNGLGDGQGHNKWVGIGPAPEPFPGIAIPEKDFEMLGTSNMEIDGVIFINHGRNLVKNKKALVLWEIRIPQAMMRLADEFTEDMTLSLWVDWNQDDMWKEGERTLHRHLNLHDQFPLNEEELVVYYLDTFVVPDIMNMGANKGPEGKDLRYLWARAVVAYDDPDMSPDGEQIFGEFEDYRLAYMITPLKLGQ